MSPAQPRWPESKSSLGQAPGVVLAFCPRVPGGRQGKGAARVRVWQRVGVGGRVLSDKKLKVRAL